MLTDLYERWIKTIGTSYLWNLKTSNLKNKNAMTYHWVRRHKINHPANGLNSSASTRYNFTSSLHVVFQYLAAILIKGYIP